MNQKLDDLIPTIREIKKHKDKINENKTKNFDKNWNNLNYALNQLILKSGINDIVKLIKPMAGRITASFGEKRTNSKGQVYYHEGLDIADDPRNKTPIHAACDGFVTRASVFGNYGNCVDIQHDNNILTRYAHCSKLLVSVGNKVSQGQPIAIVGSTGHSTGPHLHFEVRGNGKPKNPLDYINVSE